MDDRGIIDLYFARKEEAISATAKKYGDYCFSVAYNILSNHQDAEECVNDTYLRTWQSIPPHDPSSLKLFLAKITRCLALDRFKEQRRQKRGGGEATLALEELAELLPSSDRVESRLEEEAFMQAVNRFLRTLSARDCSIFVRRYFHLTPAREIGEQFGLRVGNVEKILFRTKQKLKAYLQKEGYIL